MVTPIFDGHNDVLLHLQAGGAEREEQFFNGGAPGHIDLPRARTGGFAGGLFAMMSLNTAVAEAREGDTERMRRFDAVDPVESRDFILREMALLFRMVRERPDVLKLVTSASELDGFANDGVMKIVAHMESPEPIDPELTALETFYRAGLRSLGLCWSRPTAFAEGVPFIFPSSPDTGPGLTGAGKALVAACNELGVMIDMSHLNEQGFWDVQKHSSAPLVASHSNAHALCPMTRNLTDAQLDAIKDSNGIVGINFGTGFCRKDGKADADAPASEVVRHFIYVAERIGVDHVGFGTDYDGTLVPQELYGVDTLQVVIEGLRGAGFSSGDTTKIAHGNWIRVLTQTWA